MKSFEEIKEMIRVYEQHIDEHNALWEREGLSNDVHASGIEREKELSEIYDAITGNLSDTLQKFSDIGVEIQRVSSDSNARCHAYYAKVGRGAFGGSQFIVKNFNYYR